MPTPKKNETRSQYVSRAVPQIMKEGKTQKQAVGKTQKQAVGKAEGMYNSKKRGK